MALAAEHAPQGPTEEHLVEELAGILWRKRRLRLAEAAAHRRGLSGTLASYRETVKVALVHLDATGQFERVVDAIRATAGRHGRRLADLDEDEAMTRRALDLLDASRNDAYEAALAALREDAPGRRAHHRRAGETPGEFCWRFVPISTIGAHGRSSTVREEAGLKVIDLGAPMDALWLRLSRRPSDPQQTFGRIGAGRILAMIDRGDYWQRAYVIPKEPPMKSGEGGCPPCATRSRGSSRGGRRRAIRSPRS